MPRFTASIWNDRIGRSEPQPLAPGQGARLLRDGASIDLDCRDQALIDAFLDALTAKGLRRGVDVVVTEREYTRKSGEIVSGVRFRKPIGVVAETADDAAMLA